MSGGIARLCAAILLAIPAALPARATPAPDAFVAWARDHAAPLPPCDAAGAEPIAALVDKARIIALGEPAHGAQEPLAIRNCLFRHLVEHYGFTAIAIESGLNEARQLHDYVLGGPGDARELARTGLTWGFGRFRENVALLEWMRGYNADPRHRRKIHFYGIDMSGGDSNGWPRAATPLRASLDYLARAAPGPSATVREEMALFLDRFTPTGYAALSPGERARLRSAIGRLIGFFDARRAGLVAASSPADFEWGRRDAVLARQLEALFRVSPSPGSAENLAPDDYKADAARDAAMADNVRWALEREGPDGRLLLFAHNGHIMNAPTRGGIWAVYAQAPAVMGQHLRAILADRLRIIPISAGDNGPGLPSGEAAGSIDAALAKVGPARFLLDIRPAKSNAAAAGWLARDETIRANFITENIVTPGTAFDAVIFTGRLTPAIRAVP